VGPFTPLLSPTPIKGGQCLAEIEDLDFQVLIFDLEFESKKFKKSIK
jgi:hypothetical protein